MSPAQGMFSESWHRVAREVVALSPAVNARKQVVHGEVWYVLHDRIQHEFFRVRPAAWAFIARLRGDRSVEEVWEACLELYPDEAPGQEEVIRLLSQLYQHNLFQSTFAPDSAQLFDRYRKKKQKKLRGQMVNFLFIHLPLFDPNRLLKALSPLAEFLFSRWGALLWLGMIFIGLKTVVEHFGLLVEQSEAALAPGNIGWLYLCMVGIKLFHEMGHGLACKRFGGDVHDTGVMLMIFTPLPYVDASASWTFRPKSHRMIVDAAGMYVEFFIAAIAAVVWAHTGNTLMGRLAYNVMFISSVSTMLFNLNPLLRFDGYYLLSDGLDLPNLYSRATQQLKHLFESHLFGVEASISPAHNRREMFWLTLYGIASLIYRVFLLGFIVYQVSTRFLGLGLIIAAFCLVLYFVVPLGKLLKYLSFSERLHRSRKRAVSVSAGLALFLVLGVSLVPVPRSSTSPGIIQANEDVQVINITDGFVAEVFTRSPQPVMAGDPLFRLQNDELDQRIQSAQNLLGETATRLEQARQEGTLPLITPLQREGQTLQYLLAELEKRREGLLIRAPISGTWTSPILTEMLGTWVPRGTEVGRVMELSRMEFLAVVSQKDAAELVHLPEARAEIRFPGQAATALQVNSFEVQPAQQQNLPSAALGWLGGGKIEVSREGGEGVRALESFFLVTAQLQAPPSIYPYQTGRIRFYLEPEPFLNQAVRKLRQLVQNRL